jgi:uncharacterized membrane protein
MLLISHFTRRPRLAIATGVGVLVGVLLPHDWTPLTRILSAWNIGVWLYLASIAWLVTHATPSKVREMAEREDNSAVAVLAFLIGASVLSLAAIILEAAGMRGMSLEQRLLHYAFTAATLLSSWLLVGVLFTLHYAHMYYLSHGDRRPVTFPDHDLKPDYWDFLYFSFTIAVAVQTSDVAITSRSMRKAVLAQSVLSFMFNAAILGMSINIAAGMVGGSS